jgi:hypothetical protein
MRTAERIAGVAAVIAALVVLNGAWVNQHNWQNVSWRVAMATLLVVLALVVEANPFGLSRRRAPGEDEAAVPEFLRTGVERPVEGAPSRADSDGVTAGERR